MASAFSNMPAMGSAMMAPPQPPPAAAATLKTRSHKSHTSSSMKDGTPAMAEAGVKHDADGYALQLWESVGGVRVEMRPDGRKCVWCDRKDDQYDPVHLARRIKRYHAAQHLDGELL